MSKSTVTVRIAPSPTGEWHLGNARTALFNYLFARHHHGRFYLRIEDTDRQRLVPGAEERIFEVLEWLNLKVDTYPDGQTVLHQSENLTRYQEVAHQLVADGKAYYCFATPDELEKMRAEQEAKHEPPRYDDRWHYRDLLPQEAKRRIDAGNPFVIRQKLPQDGQTTVSDLIQGEVHFENALLDDPILLKSDGYPTYHLAHVVDDHDAEVTHVIRGLEWLSSAPRHILLHQALGWEVPEYAHVPIILGPDKGKLSKRHGARPVLEYRDAGYLADAVSNFLVLLGWSSGTEDEIFTREELIAQFDLNRVHPSPAIFNQERLDWFNGLYLRKLVDDNAKDKLANLRQAVLDNLAKLPLWQARYQEDPAKFDAVLMASYERLTTLADFVKLAEVFYTPPATYNPEFLPARHQSLEDALKVVNLVWSTLQVFAGDWTAQQLKTTLDALVPKYGLNVGQLYLPVRYALTGLPASPGTLECLVILGRDDSLNRLNVALSQLTQ